MELTIEGSTFEKILDRMGCYSSKDKIFSKCRCSNGIVRVSDNITVKALISYFESNPELGPNRWNLIGLRGSPIVDLI